MTRLCLSLLALAVLATASPAADIPVIGDVEGQPLAANAGRVLKTLDMLGAPLPEDATRALDKAIEDKDAKKVQELLDKHVLFAVTINPEARLKVAKGPGSTALQQAGWTPVLVKVMNDSTVKKQLKIMSPQSGRGLQRGRRAGQEPEGRPEDRRAVPRAGGVHPAAAHRRPSAG